jgi:Flp pilus assembly protein TadB
MMRYPRRLDAQRRQGSRREDMASEQGRLAEQPLGSAAERALVVAFLLLSAALLVVIATLALWNGAKVNRSLLTGLANAGLGATLIVASARTFFFEAARSRRPRRRRAFAVAGALVGLSLIIHALGRI